MIRKSIGYCRVSSAKQSELGYGMSRQQKLLLAYVENYQDTKNLGYSLSVDNFQWMLQPGKSAFKGFNLEVGELHNFITEAMEGKHKGVCLIIENIDRFSRATPSKSAFSFLALINNGVHIHEVETNTIYTDDLNLDQLSSSVTRANRESSRKAFLSNANWKNRYENAVKNNTVLTKRVPKWITVLDNKYQLLPESNIIQYIFDQFCKGLGSTTIARYLNSNDMLIAGAKWYPQNVNRILSDKRVCGWLISTNVEREDVRLYPQIITDEQFKQVQDIKASTHPITKYKPTTNMNNLFNGVSTCRLCNAAMGVVKQTHKGKVYTRLLCSKRKEIKTCDAKSVRYDFIESAICNHIKHFDWNNFFSSTDNTSEIEVLKNELLSKISYKNEVKALIDSVDLPDLSFMRVYNNVTADIEEIQSKISSMESNVSTIDVGDFDIDNVDDRINYNLTLRRSINSIEIHNHASYDLTIVEFKYHVSNTKHILLMESLTGIVKSNISLTIENGISTYEKDNFKLVHNTISNDIYISGENTLVDIALMITFMEMINVDSVVINKIRNPL